MLCIHPRFHVFTLSISSAMRFGEGSVTRPLSTREMYSAQTAYDATLEMVANSEPRKARSVTWAGNMWRYRYRPSGSTPIAATSSLGRYE